MEDLINRLRESDLKLIEKETGIPYDRMYKWVKGKAKPKLEDHGILMSYFQLKDHEDGKSSTWVVRDSSEGRFLKPGGGVVKPTGGPMRPKLEAIPLRLADPYGFEATGQKFYTLADGSEVMQIPVVPATAWGSYPRGFADPEFYDGFESITVPVNKLHKGMYMSFEMKGESMVNIETKEMARKSIWPGQKVIGRDLRREAWQYKLHISPDEAWIIVHKEDGISVKEISEHNVETGMIKLHSWNPDKNEHPDFEWHLDDIQQIFHVVDPFAKMKPY